MFVLPKLNPRFRVSFLALGLHFALLRTGGVGVSSVGSLRYRLDELS